MYLYCLDVTVCYLTVRCHSGKVKMLVRRAADYRTAVQSSYYMTKSLEHRI